MPDAQTFLAAPDPLIAFSEWFLSSPLNLLKPPMYGVHFFGDLMSVVLYRDDHFQAELFIVRPNPSEPCGEHGHPDIDSMEVAVSGELYFTIENRPVARRKHVRETLSDGTSARFGRFARVLPGQPHTAFVGRQGGCFISLQRWLHGVKPSSIGLNWSGPAHAAEFKKAYLEKQTC